jgi:hypothetical protein
MLDPRTPDTDDDSAVERENILDESADGAERARGLSGLSNSDLESSGVTVRELNNGSSCIGCWFSRVGVLFSSTWWTGGTSNEFR